MGEEENVEGNDKDPNGLRLECLRRKKGNGGKKIDNSP